MEMAKLIHEDLTYKIRGLIYQVHNKLKIGWSEEVYHLGLIRLLEEENIPFETKTRRSIYQC